MRKQKGRINVEFHGSRGDEKILTKQIFDLFRSKSVVVVTTIDDWVVDKEDFSQPFVRLFTSSHQGPKEIVNTHKILYMLKTLGMEVEHLEIKAFIPKKKLRTT